MSLIVEREGTPEEEVATRPLRIGMIAPPWFELPPRGYGEPPSHLLGSSVMPEVVLAAEAARSLDDRELDIVHDNSAAGPLLAGARAVPTLVTMHGPVTGDNGDYYRRLGSRVDLVAISDAQRRQAPDLNWVGTVHNAIDVASFPFRAAKDDHVLWIGRFSPDKGAHLAIEAARRAGRRIVLAGKLSETAEREYFADAVRPLLGRDAEYVGEADATLKRELFARASCLVFPIQWEEPFGMVMAEALACGTPVVATPRGSVPEIVRHGETGFVVEGLDALADGIRRAGGARPSRMPAQRGDAIRPARDGRGVRAGLSHARRGERDHPLAHGCRSLSRGSARRAAAGSSRGRPTARGSHPPGGCERTHGVTTRASRLRSVEATPEGSP